MYVLISSKRLRLKNIKWLRKKQNKSRKEEIAQTREIHTNMNVNAKTVIVIMESVCV
jgi:hypothetical protein